MKKIVFLLTAILTLLSTQIFAQTNVKGKILSDDGKPILGVNIFSDNEGTITNAEGMFEKKFKSDVKALKISCIGYKDTIINIENLKPDGSTVIVLKTDVVDVDIMVVTATRTPRTLKNVPIQTRLISSDDIARADATNIEDLLKQEMPGVEFSYSMSQQMNMNFAGFAGRSVLFLVDGERLAGETMENIDFSRLSMGDVERIEIVKGTVSALYGSSANGGVVNVISKIPTDPWTLNVNYRVGEHNEQRTGLRFGLTKGKVSNLLNVDYSNKDNYTVKSADDPIAAVISNIYGNQTTNIKDKVIFKINNDLRLTTRAGYFYRTLTKTSGSPERYYDFNFGLKANYNLTQNDDIEIAYSFDEYDKSDYQEITKLNIRDYSNVQNIVRFLYNHKFEKSVLTAGGDLLNDFLQNYYFTDGNHEQFSTDVFVQYDWNVTKKLELVGALRYDYFDGAENDNKRATPKLSLRYAPINNLNLRAGYGMGFRAPTLKERFSNFDMLGIWTIRGNNDLKCETSHNFNLSAEWFKNQINISLMGYYDRVENRIATCNPRYDDNGRYIQYINLKKTDVVGGELTFTSHWNNGIGTKFSYVITQEHKHDKTMSPYMPPRPHTGNITVDWKHKFTKNYELNIALCGRAYSNVNNQEYRNIYDESQGTVTVEYPAYTIWKLSTSHKIWQGIMLTAAADNIFNYVPKYYYYNSPITTGINFIAGISLNFNEMF